MRYFITGANGQLGKELVKVLTAANKEYLAVDIDEMDITKQEETGNIIGGYRPDVVIHTAAYNNVDGAESAAEDAYRVNAVGTQNVAAACLLCGAKMVYISTDYVFDGKSGKAYSEFDQPNPQSVYGKSKLVGEMLAKQILNKLFIVRTAWLYGDGNNFVRTMLELAKEKEEVRVVNDQYGSPTSAVDLTKAVLSLVKTTSYGTYHAVNQGVTTWYEFAMEVFSQADNKKIQVLPQTTAELNRPAPRPAYSQMDDMMLKLVLGKEYCMRTWQDALAEYIDSLGSTLI